MKSIFGIEVSGQPFFPLCSSNLLSKDMEVVTEDGSPSGRKDFLVWSPPLVDQLKANGQRVSSLTEACTLFKFLITKGVKTILFCKACDRYIYSCRVIKCVCPSRFERPVN